MNHLGLSIGGTKIVGLYEAAKELLNSGYKPDIISGISAGALLALPLAMGKVEEVGKLIDNISLDLLMDNNPFNKKGNIKIMSLLRLLFRGYMTSQNKLVETLKSLISEDEFNEWKRESDIGVYIQSVDFVTGGRIIVCLNQESYEDSLLYIVSSCSIPLVTKPVSIKRYELFDGGVRNYILTPYIISNFPIKRSLSIYTRPEDYSTPLWNKKYNIFNILGRYVDIVNIEISKSSEGQEKALSLLQDIDHDIIYLPSVLNSVYDTDTNRLNTLRQKAKEQTKKYLKEDEKI